MNQSHALGPAGMLARLSFTETVWCVFLHLKKHSLPETENLTHHTQQSCYYLNEKPSIVTLFDDTRL